MSTTPEPDQTVVLRKSEPRPTTVDPVNVYAVISLLAGLLGLFPIAIVFGILAFTRPSGRGIAIAGLVLGVLELVSLLVVFFGLVDASTDDSSSTPATVTSSVFEPFVPTPEATSPTSSTPSADPTTETTTEAPAPTTEAPALNQSCNADQASVLATDANTGQNIVCVFSGENGNYRWVQTAKVSAGTHERGESCDPATDQVGRTSAGTAVLCVSGSAGGGTWQSGP